MEYRPGRPEEATAVASLRWQWEAEERTPTEPLEDYVPRFVAWMDEVKGTHTPYLAWDNGPVGMAWLVSVARPPGPGEWTRASGDLQTVYVVPEARRQGIGRQLIEVLLADAWEQGLRFVTVSSGRRALSLYERLGFEPHGRHLTMLAPT